MKTFKIRFFLPAILIATCTSLIAQNNEVPLAPEQYRRPENFQPFHYRYSPEELKDNFSEKMMKKASRQYSKVAGVNEKGKWKPTAESIDSHQTPEWFKDAKLGMFIDWGLWSVAGWAPEREEGAMYPDWYEFRIYTDSTWIKYHQKNWGRDFYPDDFIPLFTASEYQPEKLVKLAADAGMKYVVPFCKHHSGFSLWPTSFSHRNAVKMGPGKDLIKPVVESCNEHGLKFGFYFSVDEWEYPMIDNNGDLVTRQWAIDARRADVPYSGDFEKIGKSGKIPVKDFGKDYLLPQATEFIDKYDPDLIWYDGEWHTNVTDLRTLEISAYFYNKAEGRKEVAVNDRYGLVTDNPYFDALPQVSIKEGRTQRSSWSRFKIGDFFTSEFHSHEINETRRPWEECRSITQSFGFNWQDTDENSLSSGELVKMFINIVSNGGNLLLMVNLDEKGALPEIQEKRLRDMGEWLRVNGEGIYATRMYKKPSEGTVSYTQSKDGRYIYAIIKEWPGNVLNLKEVSAVNDSKIEMLGYDQPIEWVKSDEGITIKLPTQLQEAKNRPCEHAWVMKIENITK